MSKDINLIYLHVRGTLDNFAWAIAFEKFPEAAPSLNRQDVGLFNRKIKRMLEDLNVAQEIQTHAAWNSEVKERRDPCASDTLVRAA